MRAAGTLSSVCSMLSMAAAEITEAAAIAAARHRGRGDEESADNAAIDAMHAGLSDLSIKGKIVIGEGDGDDVSRLFVGEEIGKGAAEGGAPVLDIAVDPLEGTTFCAKSQQGALSVLALSEKDGFLNVPSIYMDKIAVGPNYEAGIIDLDATVADNVNTLAKAKGVRVDQITACVLDRPRHGRLIDEIRAAGAAIHLISDGDIAGIINTTMSEETFIDIYFGLGGAIEGIMAAAALACIGGQMQGRLAPMSEDDHARIGAAGLEDPKRKYDLSDLIKGEVIFSATGITNCPQMHGVKFKGDAIVSQTIVMCSSQRSLRRITTQHDASLYS